MPRRPLPVPASQPQRPRWLLCLIGGGLALAIITGLGWWLTRIPSPGLNLSGAGPAWTLYVNLEADAPNGAPVARNNWSQVATFATETTCLADKRRRLAAADAIPVPEGLSYARQGDTFTTIALEPPDRGRRTSWTLVCSPTGHDPRSPQEPDAQP
jgi:hypothetical protein